MNISTDIVSQSEGNTHNNANHNNVKSSLLPEAKTTSKKRGRPKKDTIQQEVSCLFTLTYFDTYNIIDHF